MADLKAQIPQHIKDEFDNLFTMRGLFVGEQKQDIDIRMRRHIAPAIAADGHHRHALFIGRIVQGIFKCGGKIMDQTHDLIHQETVGKDRVLPGIAFFKTRADNRSPGLQHRFKLVENGGAPLETLECGIVGDGLKLGKDLFAVDDFALLFDLVGHEDQFPLSARSRYSASSASRGVMLSGSRSVTASRTAF